MRDFIVAKVNYCYGYISTKGKANIYGFTQTKEQALDCLKDFEKYTFAVEGELPFRDGQREWNKYDSIYLNKLQYIAKKERVQINRLCFYEQMRKGESR